MPVELNGVLKQKNTANSDLVGDLGGYTLYLSPGVQLVEKIQSGELATL